MFIAIWQFSVRSPNSKILGLLLCMFLKIHFYCVCQSASLQWIENAHLMPCKHTASPHLPKAWGTLSQGLRTRRGSARRRRWAEQGEGSRPSSFFLDRWAHSTLLHPSRKDNEQESNHGLLESSILRSPGWIAASASSRSGAPACHTLFQARRAHWSSVRSWTFPLVRRKGLFSSQGEHMVCFLHEIWKQ